MDTKALRQKILDLAIRGKLVPQDPNDEPASVLLERIREQKKQMVKDGKLKPKDIKKDTVIFKGDDNLHYEKFSDGTVKCIEDEIPFELPEGWAWVRLKSVIHFIRNGASIKQYRAAKGLPITRIETIATGAIDRNRLGYANIFEVDKYASYILKDYDILMSHINSPKHLGKCALYENKGNEKIIHGMNLLAIRTFSCSLAKYMCIVFRSTVFKEFVWEHMKQAVNQASITTTSISNLLFAIPPVEEQTRIIDFFDDANKYIIEIDTDKDIIEQDISFAKSKILDLAIHGKLVPQDPNDEPASVLLERIREEKEELIKQGKIKRDKKESVIFKGDDNSYYIRTNGLEEPLDDWRFNNLPETWKMCCLGELCDYGDCINVNTEDIAEDAWILDLEDIEKDTGIVIKKVTKAQRNSVSTKHQFHSGQVLYSKLRPYLNKVVLSDADGYCTSEILPLEFKNCVFPEYARYYLMSGTFLAYANHCSYGVKMPRLGTADGKKAIFPLPPLSEQKRIVETIEFYFSQLNKISESLA